MSRGKPGKSWRVARSISETVPSEYPPPAVVAPAVSQLRSWPRAARQGYRAASKTCGIIICGWPIL